MNEDLDETDALLGDIGFIDITRPRDATPLGKLGMGGEPTSVAVFGERLALVAVDMSESFSKPSGHLAVVDIERQVVLTEIELGGQPDSVALSPSGKFIAVAIENERDEEIVVEGIEGGLPQAPSGRLAIAGSVTLTGVDTEDDGVISLMGTLRDVPREPDAVAWLPGRRGGHIATANEGDLFGGSRGFSIFDREGTLLFDSGSSLDEVAVRHGHYPESRSDNKGTEPEAIEYARFGDTDYLFVASERGGFIAVYELVRPGQPELVQLLPAPFGPEGVHAVPSRNLLVVSAEEDDPTFGVRSSVMLYELGAGEPSYPQVLSADDELGKPIAWSALSGLISVPGRRDQLLAAWDSYFSESRVLRIDVSESPALITGSFVIQGGTGDYDPEGIAVAPDGSLWIASEGNADSRRNLLVHTDASGVVLQEIGLPPAIEACRAASSHRGTLASGFEGLAVVAGRRGYSLLVAQQRGWDYTTPECEALDDDPLDENPTEPAQTRLWSARDVGARRVRARGASPERELGRAVGDHGRAGRLHRHRAGQPHGRLRRAEDARAHRPVRAGRWQRRAK